MKRMRFDLFYCWQICTNLDTLLAYMTFQELDLKDLLFDRVPKSRKFEDRLWEAADNLRASARLKSSEYAAPLLGLFFLRYASNRFEAITPQAEKEFATGKSKRSAEALEDVYRRLCGFWLPEASRYETLLKLKDSDNVQKSVILAMELFENANGNSEDASAVDAITLPKNDYSKIPHATLRDIIGIVSEVSVAEGDAFGKIYEYFLGKFALSEGQKGGEFYTPTSVVKLIVEVIEPFKTDARVFDPACGTGGMFVQSAKFIREHYGNQHISIYGQEKVNETANLCRLNLFVNGLKGDIRNVGSSLEAATYTDAYADTFGKFDYVMANPPFNVDSVKVEDVGGHKLFSAYGLPLSQSKSGKKQETFSNANYLFISLFATALNGKGRAGFVMANSASDARGGELEVRKKLIESGIVDVVVTIAPNFFYTVTLPVTLWFFDKAKTDPEHPRHNQTLFIDARKIFSQVHGSRTLREFSQAQLSNLASIVWLYRGETERFQLLRQRYEHARDAWRDHEISNIDNGKKYLGVDKQFMLLIDAFDRIMSALKGWVKSVNEKSIAEKKITKVDLDSWIGTLEIQGASTPTLTANKEEINKLYGKIRQMVAFAEKTLRPGQDKTFSQANIKGLFRELTDQRDDMIFVLERVAYFESQMEWSDTNFPGGVSRDVEGLCRIAERADIEEQTCSLNPGRHVGVAIEDDGLTEEEFKELIRSNASELAKLQQRSNELQSALAEDISILFQDVKAEAVS
jgi:type I restriction enzyme M protein